MRTPRPWAARPGARTPRAAPSDWHAARGAPAWPDTDVEPAYTKRMTSDGGVREPSGPPGPGEIIATNRLESFSDGVMAVIITIMAFNLRPPAHDHWSDVAHRLPTLLIYILSFTFIGIYWNNHHHLLRLTTTISAGVMWANLALLFSLSLVPVVTEWVGQGADSRFAASAYGLVALVSAVVFFVLVRSILRANHHDAVLLRALGRNVKGVISPLVYAAGIGLAFINPYLAYACYALVSLMWIVPDRRLVSEHQH